MIRIGEIKLKLEETEEVLEQKIKKKLHIHKEDILSWSIYKKGLDARKKETIHYVYTVDVKLKNEKIRIIAGWFWGWWPGRSAHKSFVHFFKSGGDS